MQDRTFMMMMTTKTARVGSSAASGAKKKSRALPGSPHYSLVIESAAFELNIPHVVNVRAADIGKFLTRITALVVDRSDRFTPSSQK